MCPFVISPEEQDLLGPLIKLAAGENLNPEEKKIIEDY